ncbi:MAG TPA: hypothetical protein VH079_01165 [Terriglobales bacterium]|nr:hypothetical protein [Terriglobales bacterium]
MISYFDVDKLSADRLLKEWQWLCPESLRLVAINAFGDLFLQKQDNAIFRLDITAGLLVRISDSLENFRNEARKPENQKTWFLSDIEAKLEQYGYRLNPEQCFGFKIPVVFKESGNRPNNVYMADLYECVSFLGDLHGQLRNQPDGAKVRLNIGKRPREDNG